MCSKPAAEQLLLFLFLSFLQFCAINTHHPSIFGNYIFSFKNYKHLLTLKFKTTFTFREVYDLHKLFAFNVISPEAVASTGRDEADGEHRRVWTNF